MCGPGDEMSLSTSVVKSVSLSSRKHMCNTQCAGRYLASINGDVARIVQSNRSPGGGDARRGDR